MTATATEVNMTDNDTLLTTKQLAALRNVTANRIEKERLKGDGPPFIKDGHLVRYRLGDYRDWVASKQRFNSTSEYEK